MQRFSSLRAAAIASGPATHAQILGELIAADQPCRRRRRRPTGGGQDHPPGWRSVLRLGGCGWPGKPQEVDARPSDAVNLALATGAPVRVEAGLFAAALTDERAGELASLPVATA